MSGLHYIITASIGGTLPIYPVNLTLLAFTPKEATVTFFFIFPPRCHVTQIPEIRYFRAPLFYLRLHWGNLAYFSFFSYPARIYSHVSYSYFFFNFSPRCHVTQIPRIRYLSAALLYYCQHWGYLAYLSC